MAKKVNFIPQGDRVLVEAAEAESKTSGGIIIPDSAKEKPQKGIVVAVGPGKKKDEPVTLKVGDKVLYKKYGSDEIVIDGKEYLIMGQDTVWGSFE
jgi:chaperonin GroES